MNRNMAVSSNDVRKMGFFSLFLGWDWLDGITWFMVRVFSANSSQSEFNWDTFNLEIKAVKFKALVTAIGGCKFTTDQAFYKFIYLYHQLTTKQR